MGVETKITSVMATPSPLKSGIRPGLVPNHQPRAASAANCPDSSANRPRLKVAMRPQGLATGAGPGAVNRFALWRQDNGAGRVAAFHVLVRLPGFLQRILVFDRYLDGAGADLLEQVLGHGHQVLALGGVVVERRPRGEERTLGLQDVDVE